MRQLICLAICVGALLPPQTLAADQQKPIKKEIVATLKKRLKNVLTDEDSAKFKNEFMSRAEDPESHEIALCGQVNSKNRYGGYTGFQSYIVRSTGEVIMDTPDVPSATLYLWPVWCGNPIK